MSRATTVGRRLLGAAVPLLAAAVLAPPGFTPAQAAGPSTTTTAVPPPSTTQTPGNVPSPSTVRVLVAGDSISVGFISQSSVWRRYAAEQMVADRCKVDFVGPFNNGAPAWDDEHMATSGIRADQVATYIGPNVSLYDADVVVIALGTNDAMQGQSTASTLIDLQANVDAIRLANASAQIVIVAPYDINVPLAQANFSSATVGSTSNDLLADLRNHLPWFVQNNGPGGPITLIDASTVIGIGDLPDGVHPSAAGDQKLANLVLPRLERWSNCDPPIPAAPTDLAITSQYTATNGQPSNSTILRWTDASNNETGFEVQRARFSPELGVWTGWQSTLLPAGSTTYSQSNLPDGRYAWLVRSFNAAGSSAWIIGTVANVSSTSPPAAPGALSIGSSGSDVAIGWADNSNNELGFDVMRARWVAGTWSEWTSWATDVNSTSFADDAVPDGFYAYLVRATNPVGPSAWAIDVIEHVNSVVPPNAPTAASVARSGAGIRLQWTDNSDNELLFEVQRATFDASTGTWGAWLAWPVDKNSTSFTDAVVGAGEYAYLVRARNPHGASGWAIATISVA